MSSLSVTGPRVRPISEAAPSAGGRPRAARARPMRILFLGEGDAESWNAWSGISKSLVDQLRSDGHTVEVADVGLDGADRWISAAATFSPDRRRWGTRYHLSGLPFRLRSRRADRQVAAHRNRLDLILQIGATFRVRGAHGIPHFLCCDSNIRMAEHGANTGYSDAAALTESDLKAIEGREAEVYRGASAIFPLSERLRRSFVDDFGIPADRVRAVYAGPNFGPGGVPPSASKAEADSRPPTLLFVGLQFHRKGGDTLVESFRQVRTHLPNAELLLAGLPVGYVEGPGIRCLGELDKNQPAGAAALASAYASADVFALPARFEPFGIAFVEAMHFGLPCVGPRAWAVPEIIVDGETGFTVPVDDVETLADRLLRLLRDRTAARAMGEAGRERAGRLFTWPRVIDRMLELMVPIVDGDRR